MPDIITRLKATATQILDEYAEAEAEGYHMGEVDDATLIDTLDFLRDFKANIKDPTYEGWTNKPTWAINLWLRNEQASDTYWHDEAIRHVTTATPTEYWTADQSALYGLEEQLKDEHEELADDAIHEVNFTKDLLTWALAHVDWREIAEHLINDAKESLNG